ncbi:unnamed protein product, partial [Heterotrigona itama]
CLRQGKRPELYILCILVIFRTCNLPEVSKCLLMAVHLRESCEVKFLNSFLPLPGEFLRTDLSRERIKRETNL